MRIAFILARVLIQSALTQLILFCYGLYETEVTAPTAITTTVTLLFFLAIFQVLFGLIFMQIKGLKLLLIPLMTAFATALILTLYPTFGFAVNFWILFGVLLLSGIVSYVLLYSAGVPRSEKVYA